MSDNNDGNQILYAMKQAPNRKNIVSLATNYNPLFTTSHHFLRIQANGIYAQNYITETHCQCGKRRA